jgi:endonuclease-3
MELAENPKGRRFYSLVALMLSSQTKDAVVSDAMQRMHNDGVLHVDGILALEPSKLFDDYLYSVGFRKNKAKYLQQTCQILKDQYGDDIPPTAQEMMALPGVGPKMAYICENSAWDRQSGIGVDTHMHRLFPLLGWVPKDSKSPEHTRVALQSWLPHEYWKDVNLLWVGFGQEQQQQQEKMLKKALECSRPYQALQLLRRCKFNPQKVASRYGLEDKLNEVMSTRN